MSSNEALRLRALVRAAELLGGTDRLAERLGIRAMKLKFILSGAARVTDDLFLQLVDILASQDADASGATGPGCAAARPDDSASR